MLADKFAVEPVMVQAVRRLVAEYEKEGRTRYDSANELITAGEFKEGLRELQRLTALRKLSVAKAANQRMAEVRRDPAFRTAMRDADAEALLQKAQDLLWSAPIAPDDECADELCEDCLKAAQAAGTVEAEPQALHDDVARAEDESDALTAAWSLAPEEQTTLFEMLSDLLERYPDSRAALQGKWLLETLQSDRVLAGAVERYQSEKAARELLLLALNYRANGRIDEARIALSRVMQDHAGTDTAKEASAVLAELDGEVGGG